ncbi:MAG: hypothetical protein L6R38_003290 [Xanthoria sp. 2 TBL-2021]|nr:MAG: hypothetical protein L6R38_003290 [Xanthoria sp. 2 TBL-2021]
MAKSQRYKYVDDELRDLLHWLLHKDPTKRISVKEVLGCRTRGVCAGSAGSQHSQKPAKEVQLEEKRSQRGKINDGPQGALSSSDGPKPPREEQYTEGGLCNQNAPSTDPPRNHHRDPSRHTAGMPPPPLGPSTPIPSCFTSVITGWLLQQSERQASDENYTQWQRTGPESNGRDHYHGHYAVPAVTRHPAYWLLQQSERQASYQEVLHGVQNQPAWIDETDPNLQSESLWMEALASMLGYVDCWIRRMYEDVVAAKGHRGRTRPPRLRRHRAYLLSGEWLLPLQRRVLDHVHLPAHGRWPIPLFEGQHLRCPKIGVQLVGFLMRKLEEGSEHSLSQSVTTSPELKTGKDYFDDASTPIVVVDINDETGRPLVVSVVTQYRILKIRFRPQRGSTIGWAERSNPVDILLDQEDLEADPVDRLERDNPLHKAVRFIDTLPSSQWESASSIADLLTDTGTDPRIRNKAKPKPMDLEDPKNEELRNALQKVNDPTGRDNVVVGDAPDKGPTGSASDSD